MAAEDARLPSSAADDLATDALAVVLAHNALALEDVCSVSSLSRALNDASKTAAAWMSLFRKASSMAAGDVVEYAPSRYCSTPCPCGYCDFVAWLRRRDVARGHEYHECFINPDTTVLDRVGYGRASRCLLSETCHDCGDMAAWANPLTLNRTCQTCARKDDSSALILASKVPSNFYLTDDDVADLPKAIVRSGSRGGSSVVYLLSDVLELAYAKYGGSKESFVVERGRRMEQKRPTRQSARESRGNPYKRAKVEEEAFDPLSLRCRALEAVPVGVIKWNCRLEDDARRQPIRCSCCDMVGSPSSIAQHEWFAHGLTIKPSLQQGVVKINRTESHFSTRYADQLDEPEELCRLMESVKAEYSYVKDKEWMDEEYMATNIEIWSARFDLGNCQIAIHFRDHSTDYIDGAVGIAHKYLLRIDAQIGGKGKPSGNLVEIFQCFLNEIDDRKEASSKIFDKIVAAAGLCQTSSIQLLVSLIARVSIDCPSNMLIYDVLAIWHESLLNDAPLMYEIGDKLATLVGRRAGGDWHL